MESLKRVRPLKCSFDLDVPSRNVSWYLDSGYEPFSTAIFRSACLVADVVIDIGAHIGYFSCLAASAKPTARVIAVEASPENGKAIASNAALNGFNIEVHNAAFSNSIGRVDFDITEASDNCGFSGHPNSPTIDRIQIQTITGTELNIEPRQRLLVKIDVEGHELKALEGIEQLFTESAEVRLLIEFNIKCILSAGQSPSAILEWIWDHDFRIFALDEKAQRWREVSEVKYAEQLVSGYVNLWCVPTPSALTVGAVMHSASLGGSERSHVEVVENLVGAGCMVHTILPEPDLGLSELLREVGSSTSLVKSFPWWVVPKSDPAQDMAKDYWQANLISQDVIEEIMLVDPEIVLTQTIVVPQGAIAALALGKPHVWWIREFADLDHGLLLPFTREKTGQIVASLSNKVLTNSLAVREYFFPANPDMACVVYPIPRLTTQNVTRVHVDRPWTMGIVGNLNQGKGHSDALIAMSALVQEGLDIRLACIGGGSEEDLERLSRQAVHLGISDKVTFSGQIFDRDDIYDLMDAVVITSRAEAFGRVAFEATDAGLPIIYPLSGGIVEYMVAGETGLAYISNDTQDLALTMKSLFSNIEIGDRLVSNARAHFDKLRSDPARVSLLVHQLRESCSGDADGALDSFRFLLGKSLMQIKNSIAERDGAIAERDGAIAERDGAIAERDGAIAERDGVINSRIWKFSLPYRKLRALIKF